MKEFKDKIASIRDRTVNIAILGGMLCSAALTLAFLSDNSFSSSLTGILKALFLFLICPMLALGFGFGAKVLIFDDARIWRKALGVLLIPPAILFAYMFLHYFSSAPSSDCFAGFRYC